MIIPIIRDTGCLADANLTAQQRYDLLDLEFWRRAQRGGYDLCVLSTLLKEAAVKPEDELRETLNKIMNSS
jgi:hypothetical protein